MPTYIFGYLSVYMSVFSFYFSLYFFLVLHFREALSSFMVMLYGHPVIRGLPFNDAATDREERRDDDDE